MTLKTNLFKRAAKDGIRVKRDPKVENGDRLVHHLWENHKIQIWNQQWTIL